MSCSHVSTTCRPSFALLNFASCVAHPYITSFQPIHCITIMQYLNQSQAPLHLTHVWAMYQFEETMSGLTRCKLL